MKTTNLSDHQIELWSYVTLLKGNASFWQHLQAKNLHLHGAFMTLGHPSQVHPFQTHPKTCQKTPKSDDL